MLKLSEAIRAGAKLSPQCFGWMFYEDGTCAIGAAFRALHGEKSPCQAAVDNGGKTWWPKEWLNVLGSDPFPCPHCKQDQEDKCHVITHLNDGHKWSREAIAEFVETLEKAYDAEKARRECQEVAACLTREEWAELGVV